MDDLTRGKLDAHLNHLVDKMDELMPDSELYSKFEGAFKDLSVLVNKDDEIEASISVKASDRGEESMRFEEEMKQKEKEEKIRNRIEIAKIGAEVGMVLFTIVYNIYALREAHEFELGGHGYTSRAESRTMKIPTKRF